MSMASKTRSNGGAAGRFIAPIVEACKLPLAKVGAQDTTPLGCGAYGCVYPGRPGEAVKVLGGDSITEVAGARWLMALGARRPAELPYIRGVYRLRNCVPQAQHAAYVIVREDIGATGIERTPALRDALFNIERSGDNDDCDWVSTLGQSFYEQLAAQFTSADVHGLLKAAWRLQVWACRNQVTIGDTHPDNWGRRANGDFVLRDFGRLHARNEDATTGPAGKHYTPTKLPAFGGLRGW